MHKLYELKEKLMNELEDYSENGKFSKDDVEAIKYVSSAIDHICNIVERADEEEYSMAEGGMYSGEGRSMGGSYNSYARGGRRGGYSRARGRNARRDSMGRYSRADVTEQLRDIMDDMPDDHMRMKIQKIINEM